MEVIDCRYCKRPETSFLWQAPSKFNWFRCRFCGCDSSPERYDDGIYGEEMALRCKTDEELRELARSMTHNIELWHKFPVPAKTILDVGCNEATFIEDMLDRGWSAEGFDVNKALPETLQARGLSNRIFIGSDLWYMPVKQPYGAINCREVIEHVPDPGGLLAACSTFLMDGGLIQVQTPRPMHMLEPYVYSYGHMTIFSPGALVDMMEAAGFRILYREYWEQGQLLIGRKQ